MVIAGVMVCTSAATSATAQIQSQDTAVTETYEAVIAPAGIKRTWPDGREMPKLITDIAELMRPWPWGSVGYFRMVGSHFNDYWIEGGSDLADQFGMFMRLPDGTEIAVWFHDGAIAGGEPVVEIGSEGSLRVLAPNVKAFMTDWANGKGLYDLARPTDDDDDNTPETAAARAAYEKRMLDLIAAAPDAPAGPPAPDLQAFMDRFGTKSRAEIAADATLKEIAMVLDSHVPRGKEVWARTMLKIHAAGARMEIRTQFLPPDYQQTVPLPEKAALIPLIFKAREERAAKSPGRGLWHQATLWLHADGHAEIAAGWDTKPEFSEGGPITKAELDADLARFPKSARWREPWMDE